MVVVAVGRSKLPWGALYFLSVVVSLFAPISAKRATCDWSVAEECGPKWCAVCCFIVVLSKVACSGSARTFLVQSCASCIS